MRPDGNAGAVGAPSAYPNRNAGTIANIAVVQGSLFNGAFEGQTSGETPKHPWINSGDVNAIETNFIVCGIPGLSAEGDRRLRIDGEGSNNALSLIHI